MIQKTWPTYRADGVCEIPLSQGRVALVDEQDVDNLLHCPWHVSTCRASTTFYAKGRPTGGRVAVPMHRVILCFPLMDIDHINGNGLDNRRCNLRLCDPHQNMCNIRPRQNKTSKYRGVYQSQHGWQASIRVSRLIVGLGGYKSEERAAAAYDYASLLLHGEFGVRNGYKADDALCAKVRARIAARLPSVTFDSSQAPVGVDVDDEPVEPVHPASKYEKYLDGNVWTIAGISPSVRVAIYYAARCAGRKMRMKTINGTTTICAVA